MKKPKVFVLDVDGVLTDGGFYYNENGKVLKKFGPDDNDALKLLSPYLEICFVSGDKRGFKITEKRINDMHFPIHYVSTFKRVEWIEEHYNLDEVIYMGDGIFDCLVMDKVGYSISTSDSDINAQKASNYVTKRKGGNRAVSEACLHILDKFFDKTNINDIINSSLIEEKCL
ncbi:MAG: hypothetical protein LUH05_09435 [Candidatus Gastranaerophilales bacterium]|nr:hypothetical protein [Candidatus Gastranaerophilales bacterium]